MTYLTKIRAENPVNFSDAEFRRTYSVPTVLNGVFCI